MIKFTVRKVESIALYFYLTGSLLISLALIERFFELNLLDVTLSQQLVILGAIIFAVGSVINLWKQLKNNKQ